jgi:PqqD family protein of HPr-rel-A system
MSAAQGGDRVPWRLRGRNDLRIARFGFDAVVFNPVSWQTHLLNDSALRVFEALLAGPRPLDEIVSALGEGAADAESALDDVRMIEALLADLEALGLVEKALEPCAGR